MDFLLYLDSKRRSISARVGLEMGDLFSEDGCARISLVSS